MLLKRREEQRIVGDCIERLIERKRINAEIM
jgi:predicted CopG family antitoxin